jgi:hypothetical protein
MTDPIAELKRELLDAAGRRARPTGDSPRRTAATAGAAWPRRSRRAIGVLVLGLLSLAAGAAAIGAVTGVWRDAAGTLTTNQAPSRALTALLGVLRRPQTAADRSPLIVRGADLGPALTRPVIESNGVRLATTLPNGIQIFLAPQIPSPFQRRQTRLRGDVIGVLIAEHGSLPGGGCCLDAAHIQAGGPGGLLAEAPRGAMTIATVVPDGVARVRMFFAPQKKSFGPGYWVPFTLTAAVHGNVAAATITARGVTGDLAPRQTRWLAPDGHTLKTFTN